MMTALVGCDSTALIATETATLLTSNCCRGAFRKTDTPMMSCEYWGARPYNLLSISLCNRGPWKGVGKDTVASHVSYSTHASCRCTLPSSLSLSSSLSRASSSRRRRLPAPQNTWRTTWLMQSKYVDIEASVSQLLSTSCFGRRAPRKRAPTVLLTSSRYGMPEEGERADEAATSLGKDAGALLVPSKYGMSEDMIRNGLDEGEEGDARMLFSRSSIFGKQVITRKTGVNLGVLTQLWVDPVKWEVIAFDIRPNLFFGEEDIILLSSLRQIGDVLLVHDESVIEDGFNLYGLNALVGSEIVTVDGTYLGKIRDFEFDPEEGLVPKIYFDSLGVPFVPAFVVSTYAVLVEEVVSVGPDRIILRKGAEERVQQQTVGWVDRLLMNDSPWMEYGPPTDEDDGEDEVDDEESFRERSERQKGPREQQQRQRKEGIAVAPSDAERTRKGLPAATSEPRAVLRNYPQTSAQGKKARGGEQPRRSANNGFDNGRRYEEWIQSENENGKRVPEYEMGLYAADRERMGSDGQSAGRGSRYLSEDLEPSMNDRGNLPPPDPRLFAKQTKTKNEENRNRSSKQSEEMVYLSDVEVSRRRRRRRDEDVNPDSPPSPPDAYEKPFLKNQVPGSSEPPKGKIVDVEEYDMQGREGGVLSKRRGRRGEEDRQRSESSGSWAANVAGPRVLDFEVNTDDAGNDDYVENQ